MYTIYTHLYKYVDWRYTIVNVHQELFIWRKKKRCKNMLILAVIYDLVITLAVRAVAELFGGRGELRVIKHQDNVNSTWCTYVPLWSCALRIRINICYKAKICEFTSLTLSTRDTSPRSFHHFVDVSIIKYTTICKNTRVWAYLYIYTCSA